VPFNHDGPLKYLNAEFDSAEILLKASNWQRIDINTQVSAKGVETPFRLRVTVRNTDQVIWQAGPDLPGGVKLALRRTAKRLPSPTCRATSRGARPRA